MTVGRKERLQAPSAMPRAAMPMAMVGRDMTVRPSTSPASTNRDLDIRANEADIRNRSKVCDQGAFAAMAHAPVPNAAKNAAT